MTRHVVLSGHALDILARVPLWKDGLDYRHGTGHGVGSYLNVHEGVHYWALVGAAVISIETSVMRTLLFVGLHFMLFGISGLHGTVMW